MKKLLTILLTLVMAVCLINLNNNITKADESNTDYTWTCAKTTTPGVYTWNCSPDEPSTYNEGDTIKVTVTKGTAYIKVNGNIFATVQAGSTSATYTVKNNGTTLSYDGNTATIIDAVECQGIRFWINGNTGVWDNNGITFDPNTETKYGISYDDTTKTATLSKSLKSSSASLPTLKIEGDLNVVLNDDISIIGTSKSCIATFNNCYVKINGNNKQLTLNTGNASALSLSNGGTLSNITLNCENNSQDSTLVASENVVVTGNSKIYLNNLNSSGGAITMYGPTDIGIVNGTIKGSSSKYGDLGPVHKSTSNYKYYTGESGDTTLANYIEIVAEPTGTDEMPYDVDKGFVGSLTKGSASKLIAHIGNATTSDTVAVTEGTSSLTKGTDFDIEEGSIKVVFKPSYLNSLSAGTHTLNINVKGVNYKATITVASPSSPEPSKKDESCEKVIGPTWHWNNTKGICEDYGVVGTATR